MKKMTKEKMIKANGGWGAYCSTCGWHKTSFSKTVLRFLVLGHNSQASGGHKAKIC